MYLGRDAGEYLARSHRIFGNEHGEAGYLPVVPLLVRVARVAFDDLTSVRVTIVVLVALIAVAMTYAVGERLRSRPAAFVGAVAAGLSPLVAEAVGWYGAATLLSLALLAAVLRPLDELFRRPAPRPLAVSVVLAALLALTHPFWLVVAGQVAVVAWALFAGGSALAPRSVPSVARGRGALALAIVAGAALAAVLAARAFYSALHYSTQIEPSTRSLGLLTDFAFRDARWVGVVVGALAVVAVPVGRRAAGEDGARLGVWATALAVVVLADLVLLSGSPEYTTRILYALALVAGLAFATVVALPRHRALTAVTVATVLGVVAVVFDRRADVAVPFYNRVTDDELHALYFLKHTPRPGAVLVATSDVDERRYFGAMIAGLARRAAPLPLPPAGVAGDLQLYRAIDVGRVLAGDEILILGPAELARLAEPGQPARLAMVVERARADVLEIEGVAPAPSDAGAAAGPIVAPLVPDRTVLLKLLPELETFSWRLDVLTPDHARLVVRNGRRSEAADLRLSGAQFAGAPGRRDADAPITVTAPNAALSVFAADDDGIVARFTAPDLMRRRGLGHVLALTRWHEYGLVARRPCLDPAYANAEAAVFVLRSDCGV